jgi:uncharacterized membrane protein
MMVSESQLQAKRPVSAALAGPYGHPFLPILVTVPIGAWVASLAFDIASSGAEATVPAERRFPLAVVLAHGLFAVVTLVLVLLTALGIGGS